MKEQQFKLVSQRALTEQVYELKLQGNLSEITRPGQFVNLKLDGLFLRRPISVCDLVQDRFPAAAQPECCRKRR